MGTVKINCNNILKSFFWTALTITVPFLIYMVLIFFATIDNSFEISNCLKDVVLNKKNVALISFSCISAIVIEYWNSEYSILSKFHNGLLYLILIISLGCCSFVVTYDHLPKLQEIIDFNDTYFRDLSIGIIIVTITYSTTLKYFLITKDK